MERTTFDHTTWKKGDKIKLENGKEYDIESINFVNGSFRIFADGMFCYVSHKKVVEIIHANSDGFADEDTFSEISVLRRKCANLQDRLNKKTKFGSLFGGCINNLNSNISKTKVLTEYAEDVKKGYNSVCDQIIKLAEEYYACTEEPKEEKAKQ